MTVAREPRLPAHEPRRRRACDRRAGRRDRRACSTSSATARPARARPDRRRQAEDLARARPGARRTSPPILFDEPLTVIDPHLKWQLRSKLKAAAPPARHHDDLCDPRPDRGADLRRHGRGDARRRASCRWARRSELFERAGPHLRRLLHRLAGHERDARPTSRARRRADRRAIDAARRALSGAPSQGDASRSASGRSSPRWRGRAPASPVKVRADRRPRRAGASPASSSAASPIAAHRAGGHRHRTARRRSVVLRADARSMRLCRRTSGRADGERG